MRVASKILGTLLALCVALLVLKFGFSAIFLLNQQCSPSFPASVCQVVRLVLSSLLVFLTALALMRLTNKLWGRNLFKSGPDEA
jgi:hypothetical protein